MTRPAWLAESLPLHSSLSHLLRKCLAPAMQVSLARVQAPAVLRLRSHADVHMRIPLVIVQHHHILETLPGGVRCDHLWHGAFAVTPDKLPCFWRLDEGVAAWGGCNGRGVAFDTALGPRLVDALLDGSAARDRLPFEALRPIGGHAFAAIGVAAGTLYYRWRDRG